MQKTLIRFSLLGPWEATDSAKILVEAEPSQPGLLYTIEVS